MFKKISAVLLTLTMLFTAIPYEALAVTDIATVATVTLSETSFVYDGTFHEPEVTVTVGGVPLLYQTDYYVYYENHRDVGTATVLIRGFGNYTGSITVPFEITLAPILDFQAVERTADSVYLSWGWVYCADGYEVYAYDTSRKDYTLRADVPNTFYNDTGLKATTAQKYRVRAYCLKDGVKQYGAFTDTLTAYTRPLAPTLTLKTGNKRASLSWTKVKGVNGYEVYRTKTYFSYDGQTDKFSGSAKRVYAGSKRSFQDKKLSNKKTYLYTVRTYKIIGGVKVYSAPSAVEYTSDPNNRLNFAKLKSRNTVKMVSTRKDVKSYTMTISKKDRKIMKAFEKKYFKKGMTRAEKVMTVLQYIHNETTYIRTSKQWRKISGKSYVYDIFKLNLGQCAQYNGAFAMFLAYLGYDARLVCGYRGTKGNKWSHYWCEVKIDGVTYLMDTYNKKDGNWWFLCSRYDEADGKYIKNGKNY